MDPIEESRRKPADNANDTTPVRKNKRRDPNDIIRDLVAQINSSESLETDDSNSIPYKLSITSSCNTHSSIDDGGPHSSIDEGDLTIFSGTSGEDLLSSQSQSFESASTSTPLTSPGRSPGRRRQLSPAESSLRTFTSAEGDGDEFTLEDFDGSTVEGGSTTDDGYSYDDTTFDDDCTVPTLPSLDIVQKASTCSAPGSIRLRSNGPPPRVVRGRIPGGAAAKLMFIGPKSPRSEEEELSQLGVGLKEEQKEDELLYKGTEESEGSGQPSSSHELFHAPSQDSVNSAVAAENMKELERENENAKVEFERGTDANRRYQPQLHPDTIREDLEEAHEAEANPAVSAAGPSFMNRKENFHETAEAAVASLLAPRDRSGDTITIYPTRSELGTVLSSGGAVSAFQTPKINTSFTGDRMSDAAPTTQPFESLARRDVGQKLIAPETEKTLKEMPSKMHDPNQTLTDLLTAIASPENKRSMDQGYMVRRKNACGALQVLTANIRNRQKICWSVGVLPALTSVLADTGIEGPKVSFPDKRIRIEFVEARKRAISALMNLATPKKNRVPVFHTPDLISWIVVVIMEDTGDARRGCCAILAYLAKSEENRLLLVQVPGLVGALVKVLKPRPPCVESPYSPAKKMYPWSSNEESSSSDEEEPPAKFQPGRKGGDSDSEVTPRVTGTQSPVHLSGYDETADEMLRGARQNVFALLSHLTKEKDNAYHFARDSPLVSTLVDISKFNESVSHTLAIKLLAHVTRHRLNTKMLVFKQRVVVPALVVAVEAKNEETRLYACYALQNLSQDKSCRQELAITDGLITALCNRAREARIEEERLAAVSSLKNLCDEPANLIPLTNTRDCISTLMQLAHGYEDGASDTTQYRACDGLATLSHWLRKIATSGKTLDDAKRGKPPTKELFVPSLRVVTWNQWQ